MCTALCVVVKLEIRWGATFVAACTLHIQVMFPLDSALQVAYELLPYGAGVSVMVADMTSGGVARALNSWGPKEQNTPTIVAGLEQILPSSHAIDGPAAAAAAAQVFTGCIHTYLCICKTTAC